MKKTGSTSASRGGPSAGGSSSGRKAGSAGATRSSGRGRRGSRDKVSEGKVKSKHAEICETLDPYPWFRGLLTRGDMDSLLTEEGQFVVRSSEIKGDQKFVISVVAEKQAKHFIIKETSDGFQVKMAEHFKTIQELVDFYWKNKKSVAPDDKPPAVLVKPVPIKTWELKHDQVKLEELLGEGAFGEVRKGLLVRDGTRTPVAVKSCKQQNISKEGKEKFLKEARLIRNLQHPNIVKLMGVCADHDPLLIVLEFAPNGSLDKYLTKNNTSIAQKETFCMDAAMGMSYLEKQAVMHRDLAARNCLLGNGKQLKITDFGLSRDVKVYSLHGHNNKVPIKWCAPETLRSGKYMMASDVWSYGILLWEIFSNAAEPYAGLSNKEVQKKVLLEGYRLPPPNGMSKFVADMMSQCFKTDHSERPKFAELVRILQRNEVSETLDGSSR